MAYPTIWLTRPLRRTIMGIWILLFFIISPLIILYTIGYRFDPRSGIVKQTGVISFDVKPEDASVYVNDILIDREMPFQLRNRPPGAYRVRIEHSGYHTFNKEVRVESRQTAAIDRFSLLQEQLPIRTYEDLGKLYSFDADPSGRYLLLVVENEQEEQVVYHIDTENDERTVLVRGSFDSVPWVWASPYDSRGLILYDHPDVDGTALEIRDLADINAPFKAHSSPLFAPGEWYHANEGSVYLLEDQGIATSFTPTERERHDLVIHETLFMDDNGTVWEYDRDKGELVSADDTISIPSISDIHKLSDNEIIAASSVGMTLIINRETEETKTVPATNARFYPETNEWLFWSDWEVWRLSDDQEPTFLTRVGTPILDVHSIGNETIAFLSEDNTISVYDPHYNTTQVLFDRAETDTLKHLQEQKQFLFYGTVGTTKALYSLSY